MASAIVTDDARLGHFWLGVFATMRLVGIETIDGRTVRALRFPPFELDLAGLELRRSGSLVRLQQQPAKVLALLVRRSGEPVTREEIQREVWGTDTFVDFEHGLNFCIRQIRAALGDDAAAPRFVETLPRRGYRFIAPVEAAWESRPRTSGRPGTPLVAAVAGLALIGLALALLPRSDGFEGSALDALAVQNDAAERVAQAVLARLMPGAGISGPRAGTSSPEAHDAFLKGRYHLARGGEDSLRRAVGFLENVVAREPRYAAGHAALAEAWVTLGDRGHVSAREAYPQARAAAETALALDPTSAEAWVYLGVVRTYFDWDLASGPKAFEKAIALNPNLAVAHHYSADYLAAVGRNDEAISAVRRAQALDPLSRTVNEDVGWYFYFAGRYLEAAQQFRRTADLEPQSFLPHVYSAYAYAALQDWPQALAAAGTAMRQSGTAPDEVERLLGPGGRPAYVAFLSRALAWQRQQRGSCHCFSLRAELGDSEGAIEDLQRARDSRWRYLLVEVGADPRLEPLRPDPRLQAIEREVGLRP